MARKKVNVYYELVRRYRESEYDPIREESLGLYCSKNRAMNEKEIYIDTALHEVEDEETVDLKVRIYKETIEEVELITLDEFDTLAAMFEGESYV